MKNVCISVTHINTARMGDFTRRKPNFTLPQAGFHLTEGQISLGMLHLQQPPFLSSADVESCRDRPKENQEVPVSPRKGNPLPYGFRKEET